MRNIYISVRQYAAQVWARYRSLSFFKQALIAGALVIVLFIAYSTLHHGAAVSEETSLPSVTVSEVGTLSGSSGAFSVIGSVRSITEADILAQTGGTVTGLYAELGQYVPIGSVIAELENASQRAAVLQAEGAYEAALSAHSGVSAGDVSASARNTYATAFSTLDTLLSSDLDTFFGIPGGEGPQFLISPSPYEFSYFPKHRQALRDDMADWRSHLSTASSQDPLTLLNEADRIVHEAVALGNDVAVAATKTDTDATSAQLAALATARAGFTTLQASITAAKTSYQGQSASATTGADASVKIALGGLRAAQAQLEKTLIRAPIGGTLNFLPIRVGDYVASLSHVATVAQNGTLEIVAYISEENRSLISVSDKVKVEDIYPAVITTIAPALDPVKKQIEIHVALSGASQLLNGQSVRISIPNASAVVTAKGPQMLPLTALKLTPSARVVFSVSEEGRLVAHPVTIGEVQGDRIVITTPLPNDLQIVTDARGFSEGQKVTVVAPQ